MKSVAAPPLHKATGKPLPVNSKTAAVASNTDSCWYPLRAMRCFLHHFLWSHQTLNSCLCLSHVLLAMKSEAVYLIFSLMVFRISHRLLRTPTANRDLSFYSKSLSLRPRNKCLKVKSWGNKIGKQCTIKKNENYISSLVLRYCMRSISCAWLSLSLELVLS